MCGRVSQSLHSFPKHADSSKFNVRQSLRHLQTFCMPQALVMMIINEYLWRKKPRTDLLISVKSKLADCRTVVIADVICRHKKFSAMIRNGDF